VVRACHKGRCGFKGSAAALGAYDVMLQQGYRARLRGARSAVVLMCLPASNAFFRRASARWAVNQEETGLCRPLLVPLMGKL
jgi:hypothetical protein